MRFRITIRGEGLELRGYIDGPEGDEYRPVSDLSNAMDPFGMVIASAAEDDYDPFAISEPAHPPTLDGSIDMIKGMWESSESPEDFLSMMAILHYNQAVVIRGERGRAERAERELLARELHHFETEQIIERALAMANDRESRSSVALTAVREILSGGDKYESTFGRE